MRRLSALLLLMPVAGCQSAGGAPVAAVPPSQAAAEAELRQVDLRQAQVAQSGDVAATRALLHPGYTAHVANGRLVGHAQTLSFVASGALAKERFERVQEAVVVSGDTGVVMGLDRMAAPPPLATEGERSRRYTNVYVRERGQWRLLARHFHLMP